MHTVIKSITLLFFVLAATLAPISAHAASPSSSNYYSEADADYLVQKYNGSESYMETLYSQQTSGFKTAWMNERDQKWSAYKRSFKTDRGETIHELNSLDKLLVRHQFRIDFNNENQTKIENGIWP